MDFQLEGQNLRVAYSAQVMVWQLLPKEAARRAKLSTLVLGCHLLFAFPVSCLLVLFPLIAHV